MPFTFAHPAILLPLKYLPNRFYSLTGLIVGSIVPDFEYFIRMKVHSVYSHTLFGVFWFDIPLGILISLVFHVVIRNTLIENIPAFFRKRFIVYCDFNFLNYFKQHYFIVLFSLLIGVLSHLMWDSFTHETGYFVNRFSFLNYNINAIPLFKIAQHLSSLIGCIAIIYAIYKLPLHSVSLVTLNKMYFILIAIITVSLTLIRYLVGLKYYHYGHIIATIIGAFCIALVISSYLFNTKRTSI
jgi:hypothetical protein